LNLPFIFTSEKNKSFCLWILLLIGVLIGKNSSIGGLGFGLVFDGCFIIGFSNIGSWNIGSSVLGICF